VSRYAKIISFEAGSALTLVPAESIAEGASPSSSSSSSSSSSNAVVYTAGAVLGKVGLQIKEGQTATLSSADVLCFKTNISQNKGVKSAQTAARPASVQGLEREKLPASSSARHLHENKEDEEVVEDTSSRDLVDVVSSLLSRAHVPLNLDQQNLIQENLQLQTQLKTFEMNHQSLSDKNMDLLSQVEKLKQAFICQICAFQKVELILVKCGHMICGACESQLQRKSCPFCRVRYDFTVPFFNPNE
jgi:sacsin